MLWRPSKHGQGCLLQCRKHHIMIGWHGYCATRKSSYETIWRVTLSGMLSAETAAMTWLLLATYLEFPVSTTHAIGEHGSAQMCMTAHRSFTSCGET